MLRNVANLACFSARTPSCVCNHTPHTPTLACMRSLACRGTVSLHVLLLGAAAFAYLFGATRHADRPAILLLSYSSQGRLAVAPLVAVCRRVELYCSATTAAAAASCKDHRLAQQPRLADRVDCYCWGRAAATASNKERAGCQLSSPVSWTQHTPRAQKGLLFWSDHAATHKVLQPSERPDYYLS
jgi:hypothetical protein